MKGCSRCFGNFVFCNARGVFFGETVTLRSTSYTTLPGSEIGTPVDAGGGTVGGALAHCRARRLDRAWRGGCRVYSYLETPEAHSR